MSQEITDNKIKETIKEIVDKWGCKREMLIEIFHEIQGKLNYLPEKALRELAGTLQVPLSQVYSVATFYNAFSLHPRGRHTVKVCMGTPCHVKGALRIVEAIERELDIKVGGTDKPRNFTLEITGCVGTCGLAPVIMVDEDDMHAKVTPTSIKKILKQYATK